MPTNYPANDGDWDGSETGNDDLLKRIRQRWDYHCKAWQDIRNQAEECQRALSRKGCWTDEEIEERKGKRPCIHLDQLSQHINNLVNNVRSNPIAIKVEPAGEGADDKTAELRSKRIRAIEYESNAQQAYQTAFEAAASMGYGAFGVTIEYKSWDSMQRVIRVRRFANAHAVMWDPDAVEADSSDMKDAFVLYNVQKDEFKREYPKAQKVDFGTEEMAIAKDWIKDDAIQVAEYWYLEKKRRTIYVVEMDGQKQQLFDDELEGSKVKKNQLILADGTVLPILEKRTTEQPVVKMCLTNGIEILDETDWPGKQIPIIPVLGKERYVKEGNRVKRYLDGYITMALDGQKLFDYYVSNEAEVVGQTPKMPYVGYKGQFEEEYWNTITKEPRAYAEVEATVDSVSGTLLPLPQRNTFEPPIQALEIGKESARRSIQAAVASYGVTKLDDTNVKSGVAIKEIQQQNDLGSFHFIANYKIAIKRAGKIINDLLDDVEVEPQDVSLRNMDDTQEVVRINEELPDGTINQYKLTDQGQHEVIITEGPSYDSQRQEGAAFVDVLVNNFKNLPIDPQIAQKVLAKAIRLKSLGAVGDDIEDLLDPKEEGGDPKAMLQQLMGQLEQMNQVAEALAQRVQQMELEKQANTAEIQSKEKIAQMDQQVKLQIAYLEAEIEKMKVKADVAMKNEELTTKENIEAEKSEAQKEATKADNELRQKESEQKSKEKKSGSE